jgi:hypothetical protein
VVGTKLRLKVEKRRLDEPDFYVQATIGCQEVINSLSNTLVQLRDKLALLGCKIPLVIKGYHSTLIGKRISPWPAKK